MPFLPDNYSVPTTSNYMKFQQGANKFRILGSPILGYEWWEDTAEGRRPVRVKMDGKIPSSHADDYKHFWAMVVWNYSENRIQILEITQKSIMTSIKAITQGEWGDPTEYDISVTREGNGMDTEYTTMPIKPSPVPSKATKSLKESPINLEALYSNEDPFKTMVKETLSEDVASDIPF